MVPDPILLLKREHEMILDRLRMIETAIAPHDGSPSSRGTQRMHRAATEPDRHTLRELVRFFTDQVGVHFSREGVLIATLSRSLGERQKERKRFQVLLREHGKLQADAVEIMKALNKPVLGSARGGGADPFGLHSFVRHYRAHLSCEERILFVLAGTRLTTGQRLRMSRRMLQV